MFFKNVYLSISFAKNGILGCVGKFSKTAEPAKLGSR